MKTFFKFIAVSFALILLGLAGLTVLIKVKFPPEKLKALAAKQVKIYLHRDMQLRDISIGLVNGLVLDEFKLSERPDFSAGTFVASRRLAVKPFLLPLLRGRVIIKSIELGEPEIHVTRYADGTFNFSDIAGSTVPARDRAGLADGANAQTTDNSGPVKLFVNHVSIVKGSLTFEDKSPERMNLGVKDLDLSVESFSFLTPFRISLNSRLQGAVSGKPLSGDVKLNGSVNLFSGEAVIKELSLSVLKTVLSANGSVKNFSAPEADLALKIKSFDPNSVTPFFALPAMLSDAQLSGDLTIKGGLSQAKVAGNLKVAAAGIKTDLSLAIAAKDITGTIAFDGKIGFADLTMANSSIVSGLTLSGPLDGQMSVKGNAKAFAADLQLTLDKSDLRYGTLVSKAAGDDMRISFHADLREPFTNPGFQAEAKAAKLILGPGAPMPADLKMKGPVSATVSAKGTLDNLTIGLGLKGNDLEIGYADYFAKPAGAAFALQGSAAVKDQKFVDLTSCQGTLGSMSFSARGPLGNVTAEGNMNLSFQAPAFDVGPVAAMVPSIKDYKLSGKSGLNAALRGSFALTQISGTANLKNLGAVPMEGIAFNELNGDVAFTQDSAETNNLKGKFNGSDIFLKTKIKNFSAMDLWCDGDLAQLDAAKLMAAFSTTPAKQQEKKPSQKTLVPSFFVGVAYAAAPPAPSSFLLAKTQGTFRVGIISHPNYLGRQFKLTWDLTNVDASMARCNGAADFSAADGKIQNLPLAEKINQAMKRNATDLSYSKMSGHFKITQGVLDTQDFAVNASYADIFAKGNVSLSTLQSNMRGIIKLAKGSVGGSVGDWFTDDDGRPTIEIALKGLISDPSITVDISKAAKRAGEQLLKKYLGGGSSSPQPGTTGDTANPPPPAPAEKSPQEQLKEEASKALKNLFRKK